MTLENDPRFLRYGLTFCGPDQDDIGYVMAHAIIGDIALARSGKGFLNTQTFISEKLTTRAG